MRLVAVLLLSLFPALAFASPPAPEDKYLCNCHITPGATSAPAHRHKAAHKAAHKVTPPEQPKVVHRYTPKALRAVMLTDHYPGREAIVPSNKLALPAGKSIYAKGELVFLSGRVLDEKCVPVSDAIVDIWQLNPQGKYVKATLDDRVSPDPYFTGSGRAVTDNLGRFNFVTLFPGTQDGRAPHINVHVAHSSLATLDTEMFFAGDKHNADDPRLSGMTADQRKLLMAKTWPRDPDDPKKGLAAEWDISLRGKNPWRHF